VVQAENGTFASKFSNVLASSISLMAALEHAIPSCAEYMPTKISSVWSKKERKRKKEIGRKGCSHKNRGMPIVQHVPYEFGTPRMDLSVGHPLIQRFHFARKVDPKQSIESSNRSFPS
jgi:hypothetical protein